MLIYAAFLQLHKPGDNSVTSRFKTLLEKYKFSPPAEGETDSLKEQRERQSELKLPTGVWPSKKELAVLFYSLHERARQYMQADAMKIADKTIEKGEPSKNAQIREAVKVHLNNLTEMRDLIPGMLDEFFYRLNQLPSHEVTAYFTVNPEFRWEKSDELISKWQDRIITEPEKKRLLDLYADLVEKEEQRRLEQKQRRRKKDKGEDEGEGEGTKPVKEVSLKKFILDPKEKELKQKGWNTVEYTKWTALEKAASALMHEIDGLAMKLKPEMFSYASDAPLRTASKDILIASDSGGNATLKDVDLINSYKEWQNTITSQVEGHIKATKDAIEKLSSNLKVEEPEAPITEAFKEDKDAIAKLKEEVSKSQEELNAFGVESAKKINSGKMTREEFAKGIEKKKNNYKKLDDEYRKAVWALIHKEMKVKEDELKALEERLENIKSVENEVEKEELEEKAAAEEESRKRTAPEPVFFAVAIAHRLTTLKKYAAMWHSVQWTHLRSEVRTLENIHRDLLYKKAADIAGLDTLRDVALRSMIDLQKKTDRLARMDIRAKGVHETANTALVAARTFENKSEDFFDKLQQKPKPYEVKKAADLSKAAVSKADEFDRAFQLSMNREKVKEYLDEAGAKSKEQNEILGGLQSLYNRLKKEYMDEPFGAADSILKKVPTEANEFVKNVRLKYSGHKDEIFEKKFPEEKVRELLTRALHVLRSGPGEKDLVDKEYRIFKDKMLAKFRKAPREQEEGWFEERDFAAEIKNFLDSIHGKLMEKTPLRDLTPEVRHLDSQFDRDEFEHEMEKKIDTHKGDADQIEKMKKMHRDDIEEVFNFLKTIIKDPSEHLVEDAKKKGITYQAYVESLIPPLKSALRATWEPEPEKDRKEFRTKYTDLDNFITEHDSWFPQFSLIDDNPHESGIGHSLIKIVQENPALLSDAESNTAAFLKKHTTSSHPFIEKTIKKIKNNEEIHGGGGSTSSGREKIVKHIVQGMKEIMENSIVRYLTGDNTPKDYLKGVGGIIYNIARELKNDYRRSGELLYRGDVINAIVGVLKTIPYNMQKIQVSSPEDVRGGPGPAYETSETPSGMTRRNPYEKLSATRIYRPYEPISEPKPKFKGPKKIYGPSKMPTVQQYKGPSGFGFAPGQKVELKELRQPSFKDMPFGSHIQVNNINQAEYYQKRVDDLLAEISKIIAPDVIKGERYYPKGLGDALRGLRKPMEVTNIKELEKAREETRKQVDEKAKKLFRTPIEGLTPEQVRELRGDLTPDQLKELKDIFDEKARADLKKIVEEAPDVKKRATLSYRVASNFISLGGIVEDEVEMILS